ncbi:MAG: histidinol-phosphate transaminase, partial [Thermoleophilaceae bacterium]|nr:histidinol-phosphate transaminase [Thermoleophilaceae bacterium]
ALPVDAAPSQANFVWVCAHAITGDDLVSRLRRLGVIVAPGGPLGAEDHVRITVRDTPATDRLLSALEKALTGTA